MQAYSVEQNVHHRRNHDLGRRQSYPKTSIPRSRQNSERSEVYADLTAAIVRMRSEQFIFAQHDDEDNTMVHFPRSHHRHPRRHRSRPHWPTQPHEQPQPQPQQQHSHQQQPQQQQLNQQQQYYHQHQHHYQTQPQPHRQHQLQNQNYLKPMARSAPTDSIERDKLVTTSKEPLDPWAYDDEDTESECATPSKGRCEMEWLDNWTVAPQPELLEKRREDQVTSNGQILYPSRPRHHSAQLSHQPPQGQRRWSLSHYETVDFPARRLSQPAPAPMYSKTKRQEMHSPIEAKSYTSNRRRESTASETATSSEITRRYSNGSTVSTNSTAATSTSGSFLGMGSADTSAYSSTSLAAVEITCTAKEEGPAVATACAQTHPTSPADVQMHAVGGDNDYAPTTAAAVDMAHKEVTFAQDLEVIIQGDEKRSNFCGEKDHVCHTSTTLHSSEHEVSPTAPKPIILISTATTTPTTLITSSHDNSNTNNNEEQENATEETEAVWADPVRIRENPIRYERVKTYMKDNQLPFSSDLPLPETVTFHFSDTSSAKQRPGAANYMSTVRPLFDCTTVRSFSARWRLFKERRAQPSQLLPNQNLYCFRKNVEPMWEDAVNKDGGRLTLCPPRSCLDDIFERVLCSFVGGNLDDTGMVGIVLSRRARGDRIELWLDGSATPSTIPSLKDSLYRFIPADTPQAHDIITASRFKKHYDK